MSPQEPDTPGYIKRVPVLWWIHRWKDVLFITRELTSVFVAAYAVTFLFFVRALVRGPEAYAAYMDKMKSGFLLAWHVLVMVALVYHSITWFNLAPKALVVKLGAKKVSGTMIALSNYLGWVVISVTIGWLVMHT